MPHALFLWLTLTQGGLGWGCGYLEHVQTINSPAFPSKFGQIISFCQYFRLFIPTLIPGSFRVLYGGVKPCHTKIPVFCTVRITYVRYVPCLVKSKSCLCPVYCHLVSACCQCGCQPQQWPEWQLVLPDVNNRHLATPCTVRFCTPSD